MTNGKRLIDADALQRRICGAKCGCEYEDCGNEGDCEYDHFISNAPTINAIPVVRCEKCVAHGNCFAERVFVYTGIENPYCCAGEQKEGDRNG